MSNEVSVINFYELGKNTALKFAQKNKIENDEKEKQMALVALSNTKKSVEIPLNKRIDGLNKNIVQFTLNQTELVENLLRGQFYLASKIVNQIVTCNVVMMSETEKLSELEMGAAYEANQEIIKTMWVNSMSNHIDGLTFLKSQLDNTKSANYDVRKEFVDNANSLDYEHMRMQADLTHSFETIGYNIGVINNSLLAFSNNMVDLATTVNVNFTKIQSAMAKVEERLVSLNNNHADMLLKNSRELADLEFWRQNRVETMFSRIGFAFNSLDLIKIPPMLDHILDKSGAITQIAQANMTWNTEYSVFKTTNKLKQAFGIAPKATELIANENLSLKKPTFIVGENLPKIGDFIAPPAFDDLKDHWVKLIAEDPSTSCLGSRIGQISFMQSSKTQYKIICPPDEKGVLRTCEYEKTKVHVVPEGELTKGVWVLEKKSGEKNFKQITGQNGAIYTLDNNSLYDPNLHLVVSYKLPLPFNRKPTKPSPL